MTRGQDEKDPRLELPRLTLPRLTPSRLRRSGHAGRVAAGSTGVVVGLTGVGGTAAGLVGCEAVRGVSTCGGGVGSLLLVAILGLMVLAGASYLLAHAVTTRFAGDRGRRDGA